MFCIEAVYYFDYGSEESEEMMISITDKNHKPDACEIAEYIKNPLFDELYNTLKDRFNALVSVEYSGDNVLLGWNMRFYKGGKTLCRLYPENTGFSVLLVIGKKEKERAEALLCEMSCETKHIYESTKEGMGQRWLLMRFSSHNDMYEDLLKLVELRRS